MKVSRSLGGALFGLSIALSASRASAWVETRIVASDAKVEIGRSGSATIDHAITMQIKGGPLRSFDLSIGDTDVAGLDGTVTSAQTESASLPVPLAVTSRPDGALHVSVDSPKGVSRGVFVFHVRYTKSLLTGDAVKRDGAMLRVGWTGAAWQEGLDNVKCTFVLPAAPTEPRPPGVTDKGVLDEDDSEAGIFIADVRRSADHDEVELIRPHVARGEAVRWSVRIDPQALRDANTPSLRPAAPMPEAPLVPPEKRIAYAGAAGALLFGFSLLALLKARQVQRHARGIAEPRPIVPLPTALRVLLAGPVLVSGVALQLALDDPWWGTLVVLAAMALVGYLPPRVRRAPRGPGRWLPLGDAEAFAAPPRVEGAWLDARTPAGRALFALALACAAGTAYAASRVSAYDGYLVVFDSAVLVSLFGTGSLRDLPAHPIFGPGRALGRIARKLRQRKGTRAIAWARLPEGGDQFDELRVLCAPKVPLRGFTGIEVGLVGVSGPGGVLYLPELLLRVVDASPCHDALVKRWPGLRWVRGRRAEEKVALLRPRLPMLSMTIALVGRLIEHVADTAPPRTKLPVSTGSSPEAPEPRRAPSPTRPHASRPSIPRSAAQAPIAARRPKPTRPDASLG